MHGWAAHEEQRIVSAQHGTRFFLAALSAVWSKLAYPGVRETRLLLLSPKVGSEQTSQTCGDQVPCHDEIVLRGGTSTLKVILSSHLTVFMTAFTLETRIVPNLFSWEVYAPIIAQLQGGFPLYTVEVKCA